MRKDSLGLLAPAAILKVIALGTLLVLAAFYAARHCSVGSWVFGAVVILFGAMLAATLAYGVCLLAVRRRFRFGLRVLLLASGVLGILLGTVVPHAIEAWQRHNAFRGVIDAGGEFECDSGNHDEPGWAESQLGYHPSRRIVGLSLPTDTAVVSVGQKIRYFPDVECVELWSGVTDAGLRRAQCIGQLPRLQYVGLYDLPITDAGLEMVAKWSAVHVLCVNGCAGITDHGLAHLETMKQLEQLLLVAEGGGALNITDVGLGHLSRLPRLKSLTLFGVAVSDAGLDHLMEGKNLKVVRLRRTTVTANGVERLRKALSNCEVIWDGVTCRPQPTPRTQAIGPEDVGPGVAPGAE